MEVVLPFLGRCRPGLVRCCHTCTPMSWVRAWIRKLLELSWRTGDLGLLVERMSPIQRGLGACGEHKR